MNVFVRILYSHALRFVPSRNPPKPRYARRYVSWTRSSASAGLRVMRSAAEYRADMYGIASSANSAWSAMEPGYRRRSNRPGAGFAPSSASRCGPGGPGRTDPPRAAAGRRLPETELARALRPRAPTLPGEDAFGHDDLLLPRREIGARCERAAAEPVPRRRQELQPSVKPVAGVDRPVPAALALRESVPHAGPETAVPAATEDADHGDEHRRGRPAPDPGLDLHDALPRRGLTRSPPSGKATRQERERRRPEAGGEVTRRLGVAPASGKGFRTTPQEAWSREGDSNPWPAHYE